MLNDTEVAAKLSTLERLANEFIDHYENGDFPDLCGGGLTLVRECYAVMGKKFKLNKSIDLRITLRDIELDSSLDPDDYSSYKITVKDKNNNILVEDEIPDEVNMDDN